LPDRRGTGAGKGRGGRRRRAGRGRERTLNVGGPSHPMKALLLSGLLALLALFFLTTFVPTPESTRADAAQYFSQADIDTGLRFSFERRLFFWASTAIELGLLIYLIATGAARRWADRFDRWTGRRWLLTLLLMAAA